MQARTKVLARTKNFHTHTCGMFVLEYLVLWTSLCFTSKQGHFYRIQSTVVLYVLMWPPFLPGSSSDMRGVVSHYSDIYQNVTSTVVLDFGSLTQDMGNCSTEGSHNRATTVFSLVLEVWAVDWYKQDNKPLILILLFSVQNEVFYCSETGSSCLIWQWHSLLSSPSGLLQVVQYSTEHGWSCIRPNLKLWQRVLC